MNNSNLLAKRESLIAQREAAINAMSEAQQNGNAEAFDKAQREFTIADSSLKTTNESIEFAQRNNKPVEEKGLIQMIREAQAGNKQFSLNLAKRANELTTATNVGDKAVAKELQDILNPLYANSTLAAAGAKFYSGLPMGNISIPVLGKGNVGWKGEIAAAGSAANTFTSVELTPHRLTAFIDISNMLLAEDTKDAEGAIKNDLVNCIKEKLEATILSAAAASGGAPAGILNGLTLKDGTTFANVCGLEADVEAANVSGNTKYIVSPAAKADFRTMSYGGKSTNNVWAANEVDGTPALVTSNLTAGTYVFGDFSNLAIGIWGDVDVKVDDMSQAINGCTRIVVTLYADAKLLRSGAFAYGRTRTIA